ncbi:integrase arm-type DNA-binding domain-containing protein [Glaciimonas sp. PCH181]|uniref:tyrosine-type recombinase/integrase n=1 Tax=Glaciimonas sp. PCH181 TaxID=2133943 RepID=UPI000D3B6B14|nr:integrase arm-type DNA-binding domain-containing protein [Glaciimonas sp. PCH181]PUA17317.1 integrase [Glaciimonas sp. PCH181]
MPLTDIEIRNAKAKDKDYKLSDERGLYLLINKAGKYWRYDYRFSGKRKTFAIGVYPDITLAVARVKLNEARTLVANEIDPAVNKQVQKAATVARAANSFEVVAREWFAKFSKEWAESHSSKILRRLERDIFPWIGGRPIADITPPELLAVLRRIENRGALETAHRAHQNCSQVFRYAVASGHMQRDFSPDLRGAIPPAKETHHPSITDLKGIGELMRVIQSYGGSFVTQCALRLLPLVFVRSAELRKAEWVEFDIDRAEWRVPAERMKMKEQHIVPLSFQAVVILRELHPLTGHGKYVFPGARTNGRPMSENTVNGALRRLGYSKEEMTGHGFRSMASTHLNEQGWNPDAIERQLAHGERDPVRGAYNFAEYLGERRNMMQSWADFLDKLASGDKVMPIDNKVA